MLRMDSIFCANLDLTFNKAAYGFQEVNYFYR